MLVKIATLTLKNGKTEDVACFNMSLQDVNGEKSLCFSKSGGIMYYVPMKLIDEKVKVTIKYKWAENEVI